MLITARTCASRQAPIALATCIGRGIQRTEPAPGVLQLLRKRCAASLGAPCMAPSAGNAGEPLGAPQAAAPAACGDDSLVAAKQRVRRDIIRGLKALEPPAMQEQSARGCARACNLTNSLRSMPHGDPHAVVHKACMPLATRMRVMSLPTRMAAAATHPAARRGHIARSAGLPRVCGRAHGGHLHPLRAPQGGRRNADPAGGAAARRALLRARGGASMHAWGVWRAACHTHTRAQSAVPMRAAAPLMHAAALPMCRQEVLCAFGR